MKDFGVFDCVDAVAVHGFPLDWNHRQMKALESFSVTVTFCFTPEHRGGAPHHTSPPLEIKDFGDFCAWMTDRYAR